ncbi:MAG: hypothetical protein ACJ75K_25870 [Actinomycetes bacterium]
MQRLLRMGDWDADAVGDVLRGYVLERLCNDGVLTVHENGCIKQGIRSVGGPGGTPEPAARSTTARSALSACVTGVSGVLIDRELPLRGPDRRPRPRPGRRHRRPTSDSPQIPTGPGGRRSG